MNDKIIIIINIIIIIIIWFKEILFILFLYCFIICHLII